MRNDRSSEALFLAFWKNKLINRPGHVFRRIRCFIGLVSDTSGSHGAVIHSVWFRIISCCKSDPGVAKNCRWFSFGWKKVDQTLNTVSSRGVRSLFGPTRKSSPWGNFSDVGLNQSINRSIKNDNKTPQQWWKQFVLRHFGWLIDWLMIS